MTNDDVERLRGVRVARGRTTVYLTVGDGENTLTASVEPDVARDIAKGLVDSAVEVELAMKGWGEGEGGTG